MIWPANISSTGGFPSELVRRWFIDADASGLCITDTSITVQGSRKLACLLGEFNQFVNWRYSGIDTAQTSR